MYALINCFLKAYHFNRSVIPVYKDELSKKLLLDEYDEIAKLLTKWITIIDPGFTGTDTDALYLITEHCLAPAVVTRTAFRNQALQTERNLGCKQFLIFGAGYDTYSYIESGCHIKIFELDSEEIIQDKVSRLNKLKFNTRSAHYISCNSEDMSWKEKLLKSDFAPKQKAFCSLSGITQYISKNSFANILESIASITPIGSAIVFDYHCGINITLHQLAEAAGKPMKSIYSYREMEALLSKKGFRIYEHLNSKQITDRYYKLHNTLFPQNRIEVGPETAFCLAVRK